jgi:hypothetical protein
MAKWDITGTWIGEYSYDPHFAVQVLPPPISFSLSAHLGWLGRFQGTIQDDPVGGTFEAAAMVGRVCGHSVSFRKQYPHYYVFHEEKLMTLKEQLQAIHGIALDEDPPAEPIWYRGQYDGGSEVVKGLFQRYMEHATTKHLRSKPPNN